jgi:hypothetical protein
MCYSGVTVIVTVPVKLGEDCEIAWGFIGEYE